MIGRKPQLAGPDPSLPADLEACRRCDLWKSATRAVPGEGRADAKLMLVGEQPGDQEDLSGRPFVGPAGRLLNELLEESGLERERVFVTNAVKHFKWEPRGKRRLHQRPNAAEIDACHIWLDQELAAVHPLVVVALGATAARALLGVAGSIEKLRGEALVHRGGARIFVTYHPSAVLRADERAQHLRRDLLQDLRLAKAALISRLSNAPQAAALVAGRRS
jgi:uracil-DNA glycosylase family protein